ncbi:hypothetical protein D3C75_1327760 [compost metagenome]
MVESPDDLVDILTQFENSHAEEWARLQIELLLLVACLIPVDELLLPFLRTGGNVLITYFRLTLVQNDL